MHAGACAHTYRAVMGGVASERVALERVGKAMGTEVVVEAEEVGQVVVAAAVVVGSGKCLSAAGVHLRMRVCSQWHSARPTQKSGLSTPCLWA